MRQLLANSNISMTSQTDIASWTVPAAVFIHGVLCALKMTCKLCLNTLTIQFYTACNDMCFAGPLAACSYLHSSSSAGVEISSYLGSHVRIGLALGKACDAGIFSNTSSGSLGSIIKEQLQQSGVLQQLSTIMQAMTAELQAETAAFAAGGSGVANGDLEQLAVGDALQPRFAAYVGNRFLLWGFWEAQAPAASGVWGPNGLAVAVLQFVRAGLQHTSSVVQHVMPAMQEHSPQLAAGLLHTLQRSSRKGGSLYALMVAMQSRVKPPPQQQGQGGEAGAWQQLLQSPHMLPCVTAVLLMASAQLGTSVATQSARVHGSSGNGSSSSSRQESSSSGSFLQTQQQQPQCGAGSSSSSSGGSVSATFTACQLQLLQLLGLAPEVAD